MCGLTHPAHPPRPILDPVGMWIVSGTAGANKERDLTTFGGGNETKTRQRLTATAAIAVEKQHQSPCESPRGHYPAAERLAAHRASDHG